MLKSAIVVKALMEEYSLESKNVYVYVFDLWCEVSNDGRDVVCMDAFGKL